MDAKESKYIVKLLPSMTDFAFLMPLVFLFGRMQGAKTLLSDCDAGWHIRTGEWILANGRVPVHDMFSFSKPGEPWYAWEWGSDVIWALLTEAGGLAALALFGAALIAATYAIVFRTARRRANPAVALALTMVAAAASSVHWLARPHLFTLFFAAVFCAILERVREGRTKAFGIPYLAILPALTVLWTNLHGGFFVGIILAGGYGAGELLKAAFAASQEERREAGREARRYLLCSLACAAASFANPYGYRLHAHIVGYLFDPFAGQHIGEFLSINFRHPSAVYFEILLLASAGAAAYSVSRRNYAAPLLMLTWAHGALLSVRNIPIFVIVSVPPIALALDALLAKASTAKVAGWLRLAAARTGRVLEEAAETDGIGRWHVASACGVAVVAALLFAPNPPAKFRAEFDPKVFPAAALATLEADPEARVYAHDQWGDYLIYRMYPKMRVFLDGRSDFYGADFEKKALDVRAVSHGWDKTLSQYKIDTILTPPGTPIAGALKESSRWSLEYDDGIALVFRSRNRTVGGTVSIAAAGEERGRDREITKTEASDRSITQTNTHSQL